jgi:hypothetical protein
MMQSAAQVPALQISPGAQLIPFATLLNSVVLVAGWHVWQAFAGFD